MTTRRSFIRQTATLLGSVALHQHVASAFPVATLSDDTPEEDFWRQIRQAYAASPTFINLNNGGVCPSPRATLDAIDYYNRLCAEAPSYYMWRIIDQNREPLRDNLAALAGVSAEEIALNRNTTEALTFFSSFSSSSSPSLTFSFVNLIVFNREKKLFGILWLNVDDLCKFSKHLMSNLLRYPTKICKYFSIMFVIVLMKRTNYPFEKHQPQQ